MGQSDPGPGRKRGQLWSALRQFATRIWRDAVFATVVGGLILALLLSLFGQRSPPVEGEDQNPIAESDSENEAALTGNSGTGYQIDSPPTVNSTIANESSADPAANSDVAQARPIEADRQKDERRAEMASAEEAAPPLPPLPRENCPSPLIHVTYSKPDLHHAFAALTGSDSVRMRGCDPAAGTFRTEFPGDRGRTLTDTAGIISDERITFDYGYPYISMELRCSVNARAVTPRRLYKGTISCSLPDYDLRIDPTQATIEL